MLLVGEEKAWKHPIVLTEFGGIAYSQNPDGTWGYSRSDTSVELLQSYSALLQTVRNLPALAGFCYTQFTDTYQEANGLLFADRTFKAPYDQVALATSGDRPDYDKQTDSAWRDHFMQR